MELNVKALSPKIGTEIPAPFYASAGAAAMDLHACVDQAVTIPAGGRAVHPHWHRHRPALRRLCGPGVRPQRPGHQTRHRPCQLRGRHRQRLPGRDPGGTARTSGDADYVIQPGDRIAQLMVVPVVQAQVKMVDQLDETQRGRRRLRLHREIEIR